MAGLFDYQDPESVGRMMFAAGLLNASGPSRMPVSAGQAIAQGLLGRQEGASQAAQNARRNLLLEAQARNIDVESLVKMKQLEAIKAKQLQQAELQKYLSSLSQPQYPQGATIMSAEGQAKMQGGPRTPQIDPLELLRLGVDPDEAQKMAGMRDWGLPKVTRTIDVEGPGGTKLVQQLDDFGRPVGEGLPGYIAPQGVNQGNQYTFVKPVAGTSLPMGMSPAEQQANARGWAGIGLQREGLQLQREKLMQESASDRRAAEKAEKEAEAAAKRQANALTQANTVLSAVDEALKKTNILTTGPGGAVLGMVPGTTARDYKGLIDTVKANIGFQELQAMREASPTGGALGQIAVRELEFLQAALASLDIWQSPSQVEKNLKKVQTHYNNWKATVQQAQSGVGGGGSDWGAAPSGGAATVDFGQLPTRGR